MQTPAGCTIVAANCGFSSDCNELTNDRLSFSIWSPAFSFQQRPRQQHQGQTKRQAKRQTKRQTKGQAETHIQRQTERQTETCTKATSEWPCPAYSRALIVCPHRFAIPIDIKFSRLIQNRALRRFVSAAHRSILVGGSDVAPPVKKSSAWRRGVA